MDDVSTFRLYLLRGMYLLIVVGLGFTIWPQIINYSKTDSLWYGVGLSMLGAVSILAAVGIRYPLAMLPVLFFELTWKLIWFIAVAYPLWSTGRMDANHVGTAQDSVLAVIILFVMPWRYVWNHYVKKPGDRWRRSA